MASTTKMRRSERRENCSPLVSTMPLASCASVMTRIQALPPIRSSTATRNPKTYRTCTDGLSNLRPARNRVGPDGDPISTTKMISRMHPALPHPVATVRLPARIPVPGPFSANLSWSSPSAFCWPVACGSSCHDLVSRALWPACSASATFC